MTALPADIVIPKHGLRVIAEDVCRRHKLSMEALIGPERRRWASYPRQEFMALARQRTRCSYPRIGQFLGGRDHTTVMHGERRHWARMCGDA
jgi:chromosomal replication initiator protein